MISLLEWFEGLKTVKCLFCEASISRKTARSHTCPQKSAAEQRLGTKLAVYDSIELLNAEVRRRELIARMAELQQS